MERIADLDELLIRCRPGASKTYAEEAVAAYRAGAYRACIVTIWIAVVFDIIEKMREIAIFGNVEAKNKIDDFHKWQNEVAKGNQALLPKVLKFERDILEYVTEKFEILDGQQLIELKRIQDDRNRCAHPTLQHEGTPYQPIGEVARAHLCNAMLHLLQHPPVQGRSALAELRKTISSSYFPQETAPAKQALIEGILARPSIALIRGAVDEILFGIFQNGDTYYHNRRSIAALAAIIEIQRSEAEPRVTQQFRKIFSSISDEEIPYSMALILQIPECKRSLVSAHYQKIRDFIRKGPINTLRSLAPRLQDDEDLRGTLKDRINTMDAVTLGEFVKKGVLGIAVDRIVELYCSVRNWTDANLVAESLVMPVIPLLNESHIRRIISAPKNELADLPRSNSFVRFIQNLVKQEVIKKEDLVQLLTQNDLDHLVSTLDVKLDAKDNDESLSF